MNKKAFAKKIQGINFGDKVKLSIRGNYGDYTEKGTLIKIKNGYVYLDHGFAHSYKRLLNIKLVSKG